jgi:gas vesicle protein
MFSFYKKYEQENQKKVATSAVIGIVAGAITALFLSPIKGSQARKIVANKAKNVAQKIENRFSDTVNAVEDGVKDIGNNIKVKADDAKAKVNRDINKARNTAAENLSDAADKVNPNT